jgi:carbamoyltransferase
LQFLGIGKTKFNSSVCLIDENCKEVELLLTERLNRKKNSGAWPEFALKEILPRLYFDQLVIGENRDVHFPKVIEDIQNQLFPFYEYLKKNKLDLFLGQFNPDIKYVPHHLSHAYAALALSPFEKSIIIVMDGAGTELSKNEYEECTVFLQDGVNLRPVFKRSINFEKSKLYPEHTLGNKLGASYEKVAEFIFNSPSSSGKVMGLAPFGKPFTIDDYLEFQENLPWSKSFKGKSKRDWEKLDHQLFQDLAATIQLKLEKDYNEIIVKVRAMFPDYNNLILAGGCALNCTNNAKILYQKIFEKIYIPPFPGDECIGFGVAHFLKYLKNPTSWKPVLFENQSAYFGPKNSIPTHQNIENEFNSSEFEVQKLDNLFSETAKLLLAGKIIAWFQDRSESGPRALGNRSILVRPDILGIQDLLNQKIKFRENFRPFGCSVLHDKADQYFDVGPGLDNPYMSYAIKVRHEFKDILKEVSHIDGTSRMQTVRIGQNNKFYQLLKKFGDLSGLYCLLNTSLNVMDEPILETVSDAKRFLLNVDVDYLVIGDFLIRKKK